MFYSRWSVIDNRGYALTKEEARRARLRRPARPVVVVAKLKAVLTLCSCPPFAMLRFLIMTLSLPTSGRGCKSRVQWEANLICTAAD